MLAEAWQLTEFVLDDEGNMSLRVLPEPRLRVERAPLPRHRTRSELGIGNAWGFTGIEGAEPVPATEKERRLFGGNKRMRRSRAGSGTRSRNARATVLEQLEAMGEDRMRYGRKTLVSLEETIRGKSKRQRYWQWRCECGSTGYVPCVNWVRRQARVGVECTGCSRKSTTNKRNGSEHRAERNGL